MQDHGEKVDNEDMVVGILMYVFTNKLNDPMFAAKVTPLAQNSQTLSLDITLKIEKVTKPPQSAFVVIMSQNRASKMKLLTDDM
eukprot:2705140-Ditylum_brightwellii.AAC.1